MGKNKNIRSNKNNLDNETFFAASTSDCTGLIPFQPESDFEIDAYNEMYNIYPEKDEFTD